MQHGGSPFSPQELDHYQQLFAYADKDGLGYVDGLSARDFLMSSGVPKQWLRALWDVAAQGQPGLDRDSFCVAMRLLAHAQAGRAPAPELVGLPPPTLPDLPARRERAPSETSLVLGAAASEAPSELQPVLTVGEEVVRRAAEAVRLESRRGRSASPATPRAWSNDQWRPSRRMLRKYAELFLRTDGDGDGFVEGREAATLLERAQLDPGIMAGIRMYADQDRDGGYVWPEFVCLVHMVTALTRGAQMPQGELPRELIGALARLEPVQVLAQERQASRSRSHSPAPAAAAAAFSNDFGGGGFGLDRHDRLGAGLHGDTGDALGAGLDSSRADGLDTGLGGDRGDKLSGGDFGDTFGAQQDGRGFEDFGDGLDKHDKKHKKEKKHRHHSKDSLGGGGDLGSGHGALTYEESPFDTRLDPQLERRELEDQQREERFELERREREHEEAQERRLRREKIRRQVEVHLGHFSAVMAADQEVSRMLEREVADLEEELRQVQDAGSQLERQVRGARNESSRFKAQGDDLERELDELRRRLADLKDDQRAVNLDSLSMRRDRVHLSEELSMLEQMASREEQALEVMWDSNQFLEASYKELEEQTADLPHQRRELLQAMAEETQVLKAKERENAELRARLMIIRREQASDAAEQRERQQRERQVRAMQGDLDGRPGAAAPSTHSWATAVIGGRAEADAKRGAAPARSSKSMAPHTLAVREGI